MCTSPNEVHIHCIYMPDEDHMVVYGPIDTCLTLEIKAFGSYIINEWSNLIL